MIKNGARLLRARRAAAEGKRRTGEQQATSRYSLHHQLLDQQLPLPPAFLLPAWSSAAVEKTVARGASSSRQSTTRRHASSYAHAELTRSHDGYTPDWLAGDVCEASAAASTSKALPVLQASTSVQPASRSSKAAMSVDTPSASAKGKLSDLQAASSDLPVASPKPGRTTSKNLAEAVEDAQIYLKQESTLSDPQGSTLSFKTILQLDLPVAILPLELQRTLIHPTDPTALQRDIPLTTAETLKASEHLNIRYNLACRILNAVLSRSTGQSRLLASERASVAHVLQDLVFLKANSISAILDSLPVSRGSDRAMYKGLPRIVKDALLAYMYRDTREQSSHVSSSTHSTISTSSGFQDSQLRQDFLVNHIRHSTRRLRRLPSSQLASFVSCHLDLFKDLSQSLQIEDSSTPSSVLQILQCISGLDIGKVHPIQPEQTLHSVLEMFAIPLKHVCSPSRKASNSTDSLFVRKLENSLLRAWHSSVMPLLKLQSAHSSLPETLLCAVQNLQHLAVQTQLAELSIRVALDVYDANRLLDKPHKSAWAFSLEQWNSIIAMCLRTGHNEQAEALLQRMSEVLQHQKQDGDSSMYWHLRLRAILRSDLSNCRCSHLSQKVRSSTDSSE